MTHYTRNEGIEFRSRLENEYNEALKKAHNRPSDFGFSGRDEIFDTWTLGPVLEHRDSDILDQSNSFAIQKALTDHPEFNGQWEINHCGHWTVGWVDHLSYKTVVVTKVLHTEIKRESDISKFITELYEQIERYPILDEQDYSEREYESVLWSIRDSAEWFAKQYDIELPDNYEYDLYRWYDDNGEDMFEDFYPDDNVIEKAMKELGWLK